MLRPVRRGRRAAAELPPATVELIADAAQRSRLWGSVAGATMGSWRMC